MSDQDDLPSSPKNQSSAVSVQRALSPEMLCYERNEHQEAMEEIGGCVLYDALHSCIDSFQTADALIENFSLQLMQEKHKGHITYDFMENSKYWFDCFIKSAVIKSDLLKQLVKQCTIMKRQQKVKGNLLLLTL
jgi:hypothetical protein